MKKILLSFMIALCVFGFIGCDNQTANIASNIQKSTTSLLNSVSNLDGANTADINSVVEPKTLEYVAPQTNDSNTTNLNTNGSTGSTTNSNTTNNQTNSASTTTSSTKNGSQTSTTNSGTVAPASSMIANSATSTEASIYPGETTTSNRVSVNPAISNYVSTKRNLNNTTYKNSRMPYSSNTSTGALNTTFNSNNINNANTNSVTNQSTNYGTVNGLRGARRTIASLKRSLIDARNVVFGYTTYLMDGTFTLDANAEAQIVSNLETINNCAQTLASSSNDLTTIINNAKTTNTNNTNTTTANNTTKQNVLTELATKMNDRILQMQNALDALNNIISIIENACPECVVMMQQNTTNNYAVNNGLNTTNPMARSNTNVVNNTNNNNTTNGANTSNNMNNTASNFAGTRTTNQTVVTPNGTCVTCPIVTNKTASSPVDATKTYRSPMNYLSNGTTGTTSATTTNNVEQMSTSNTSNTGLPINTNMIAKNMPY